jgi:putative hemolysin
MSPIAGLALLLALCLLLSILFTAVESAYDALATGKGGDEPAPEIPEDLLNAFAVGNLLADIGAAASAALGLRLIVGGDPGIVAWAILILTLTLVLLIPCEMVPRSLGALNPTRTIGRWSGWLRPWLWLSRPIATGLTRLGQGIQRTVAGGLRAVRLTPADVRSAVETADAHLALESEERDMVNSIFSFGETTVREVMVPRPDIVAVELGTEVRELLQFAREVEHSRIPVYMRGSLDDIVGIIHVKDLLARRYGLDGKTGMEGLLREVLFVPESKKIDDLLREFQSEGMHIAIVLDEYGGTAGLVTIEDILEEIVGEIQDEHDVEEPLYVEEPDGSFLVDARMDLDDFGECIGATLDGEGFETVGGLVYSLLGRVPAAGEEVTSRGLAFRVVRVDGRRIQKLRVAKLPAEAAALAEPAQEEQP